MPNPSTTTELLELVLKSGIHTPDALAHVEDDGPLPPDPVKSAAALVKKGFLTPFQAKLLLNGRYRGFKVGPYVIREQIGQGGMGTVYLAEHAQLRRRVAVKVLSPAGADGGAKLAVERFLREARSAAALDHPNIVRIFDVAQLGEVHYLVMEYVDGQTLDKLVQTAGPIACGRAVEYITQAAAGLQHAYEKGFVHRDIKPANLMLAKDGTIKILDMGLARSFDGNDKLTEVLDKGAVVGTADYISPEQAMNNPDLDIRADIYSLGATFFNLVAGRPPFDGNTTQKLLAHQMKEAPTLASIDRTFPEGLSDVVAKMLAKKPDDRFQTPAEVISALAPWLPNSARVVAGISRTDLGKNPALRNTLNEVVTGSTKNLKKALPAPKSKLPLIAGLAAAGLLAAGLGGAYLAGAFSSGVGDPIRKDPGPTNPAVAQAPVQQADPQPEVRGTPVTGGSTRPAVVPITAASVVVFDLDLTYQGKFAATGKWDGRWQQTGFTGDGKPPLGWGPEAKAPGTDLLYSVDDIEGSKAVGVRATAGAGPAVLVTKDIGVASGKGRATVEYHTEKGAGPVVVRWRPMRQPNKQPAAPFEVAQLPPSPGGWTNYDFMFEARGSAQGHLEFVTATDPGAAVWLRGLTVRDQVGPPGKRLARLDLSQAQPFRMRGTKSTSDPLDVTPSEESGSGKLPAGWRPFVENPGAVAEFLVDGPPGKMAAGVRAISGTGTVAFVSPEFTTVGGTAFVRMLYQTEPKTTRAVVYFRPKADPTKVIRATELPATNGEWRWGTAKLDRDATAGTFELTLPADEPGGLRVREFIVSDPDQPAS
jgi:serine/threonine protein kinase